ncbi:hypothetical protein [uncultured Desulfobulbus sp.]|nr:hypothetical protein [uncultured Desulfobulbus sp.]
MKKTRFTENKIIAILKGGEAGIQVKERRALLYFELPYAGARYID